MQAMVQRFSYMVIMGRQREAVSVNWIYEMWTGNQTLGLIERF
jgi:hypothetical protein